MFRLFRPRKRAAPLRPEALPSEEVEAECAHCGQVAVVALPLARTELEFDCPHCGARQLLRRYCPACGTPRAPLADRCFLRSCRHALALEECPIETVTVGEPGRDAPRPGGDPDDEDAEEGEADDEAALAPASGEGQEEEPAALPARVADLEVEHGVVEAAGPGMAVEVVLGPEGAIPEGASVQIALIDGAGREVRSRLAAYSEDGGALFFECLEWGEREGLDVVRGFLPYAALPKHLEGEVQLLVCAFSERGEPLAQECWRVDLPRSGWRLSHNALAGWVGAAVRVAAAIEPLRPGAAHALRERAAAHFGLDEVGRKALWRRLEKLRIRPPSPEKVVRVLSDAPERDRAALVSFALAVAEAQGGLSAEGRAELLTLCGELGLPPPPTPRPSRSAAREGPSPLEVLELASDATWEQVREAYRRLAGDYHPDRVADRAKGFQDYATRRMQEINVAYEALKKRMGR